MEAKEEHRTGQAFTTPSLDESMSVDGDDKSEKDGDHQRRRASKKVHMRQYFPETLFWAPDLVTDDNGHLSTQLVAADSITSWKITALASNQAGIIGSNQADFIVFQPFFIDPDLPTHLTRGDAVTIPVAIYNYLDDPQDIEVHLQDITGLTLLSDPVQRLTLEAGEVSSVPYSFRAEKVGGASMTFYAAGQVPGRDEQPVEDAIKRRIEVHADGKMVETVDNGNLSGEDGALHGTVHVPVDSIEGSNRVFVKFSAGTMAVVVGGVDGMLRMPSGCFEQTSSTTYPNVLIIDYMKASGQLNHEIETRALEYIALGYQRLVSFEVPGGGFEWFGSPPAHLVLTAYGLNEFADMSRVFPVDTELIARTQSWLLAQQNGDGSFNIDDAGIAEGATNAYAGQRLRTTAYVTWALLNSGLAGEEVERAIGYIKSSVTTDMDSYTLAICANALITYERRDPTGKKLLEELDDRKVEGPTGFHWTSGDAQTLYGSTGGQSDFETTALVAIGMLTSGSYPTSASAALDFLVSGRDAWGTWGSTQSTILTMTALLMSSGASDGDVDLTVDVFVNGEKVGTQAFDPSNYDVMRQIDVTSHVRPGDNAVRLEPHGDGAISYQLVARSHVPYSTSDLQDLQKPLEIDVAYDRLQLTTEDRLTTTVTVTYNGRPGAVGLRSSMVLVDLGVPPGFKVSSEDLIEAQRAGTIRKFSVAPRQVVLYLDELEREQSVEVTYSMRAKYPIKAQIPASQVYEYYNPEIRDETAPVQLEVTSLD